LKSIASGSARCRGDVLPAAWYRRDSWEVAPALLNKVLAVRRTDGGWSWARVVEVEAYAWFDEASHTFRGPTPRNQVMYGPGGHLYVYFSYGVHWCANVVTGPKGSGQAVLLRAAEPLGGLAEMRAARGGMPDRDLCRGPARLTQALGLTGSDNGVSVRSGGVLVLDDGAEPPASPHVGPRVGISRAVDVPWRWVVPGSRYTSGPRPQAPTASGGGCARE
jgi:DNA-3-methyladenine glycosylase